MGYNFELKFDSLFENGGPPYDDVQKSTLLSESQFRIVMDYYDPIIKNKDSGFEVNEKTRKILSQLIKNATLNTVQITGSSEYAARSADQNGVHPKGVFIDLPTDFFLAIEEAVTLTGEPGTELLIRPVKHDEYMANINNPYKQPSSELVWRMDFSRITPYYDPDTAATPKRVELIPVEANSLGDYRLRYLSIPPDIVVDTITTTNQRHCILDEGVQRLIVDEAVKIAAAAANPEEYQLKVMEREEGRK